MNFTDLIPVVNSTNSSSVMDFNDSNSTIEIDPFEESNYIVIKDERLISDETLDIIQLINHLILSGIVCLFGIGANIINMIVFYMQGLNTTMNISFFAMAVSDLCSLITLEWVNICLNPFMRTADLPFIPMDVQYLTGGWPHACFVAITCWITAYITVERWLCVAFPLKIKQMVTPTKARIIICIIYLVMLSTLSLEYATLYFGDIPIDGTNETRVGLSVYVENMETLDGITFIIHASLGFISFTTVIIFTVILIYILKRKAKWRSQSMSDKGQSETVSSRDRRTMTMVVLIAVVLIVCFAPANLLSITVFIEPEFDIVGKYVNVFHTCFSVAFFFEAVNSSVNLILYYKMSSKYRQTFHQLFGRCCKLEEQENNREPSLPSVTKSSGSLSTAVSQDPISSNENLIKS